jgi:hypothetical protein
MPVYRIQTHTRHESAEVLAGYIREADKWTKSGLDGVGFRAQAHRQPLRVAKFASYASAAPNRKNFNGLGVDAPRTQTVLMTIACVQCR